MQNNCDFLQCLYSCIVPFQRLVDDDDDDDEDYDDNDDDGDDY